MSSSNTQLTRLSYNELHDLLDKSAVLEGSQAEAFSRALSEVPLYQNEPRLQMIHTKALLARMSVSSEFQETLILSHIQESVPSFYLSLTLRQYFARGLVIAAGKNPTTSVVRRAIERVYKLPSFGSCPVLQRCAGELLLEGVASAEEPETAHEFIKQFKKLPGLSYSKDLQSLEACAVKQARRAGRDPIVKIDLNQKMARPFKAMGKLFGMGDFRLKVQLRGLEYYDEAVVKVPAFNEAAAKRQAEKFIIDFLKNQTGGDDKSAKILDIYPPGSAWESGRHPVLNLRAKT